MDIKHFQELQKQETWELEQRLLQTDDLYCHCQVLQVLINRVGRHHRIDQMTVEERLEGLIRKGGTHQVW